LNALGIDAVVVPESSVLDGINVVRRMLGRTWIDVDRCERGIEALRQYRARWCVLVEGGRFWGTLARKSALATR